jgi:hypothetical protein
MMTLIKCTDKTADRATVAAVFYTHTLTLTTPQQLFIHFCIVSIVCKKYVCGSSFYKNTKKFIVLSTARCEMSSSSSG